MELDAVEEPLCTAVTNGAPYSAVPGRPLRARGGRERVHVVEGAAVRQPVDQRRSGSREANLVPADVRQLQRAGLEAPGPRRERSRGRWPHRARSRSRTPAADPGRCPAPASRPRRTRAADHPGQALECAPSPAETPRRPARPGPPPRAAARGRWSASRERRRARAPSRPSGGCPCRSPLRRSPQAPRRGRSCGQRPLRAGHAGLGRIDRDRLAQRTSERLERGLDHVVGVAAGFHA